MKYNMTDEQIEEFIDWMEESEYCFGWQDAYNIEWSPPADDDFLFFYLAGYNDRVESM